MRTILGLLTVAVALAWAGAPLLAAEPSGHSDAPVESFDEYVPGASRLEGRLLAPCCWDASRQTLDIHGSPIANELRREIRTRLKAGETPEAVEADLVRRYTTKILAVPPDSPLPRMGPLLTVFLIGGGVFAGLTIAKWKRRAKERPAEPAPGHASAAAAGDEWDRRLDAELDEAD